ncbi:GDSL-type esterase/lipase family protein [Streptomyces polygonati]|uniref:GDSL-type esterase/lipase family protein n=1 Tax=Streptomyces polygonati TaxID=1617087 RepID=A0ABV8HUH3_9ACTN
MRIRTFRFATAALGTALGAVAASLFALPQPAALAAIPGESNGGVRVMPLGDSITDGYTPYPGGYRVNLWQRLAAGGYKVDFVGSQTNGPAALGDHDHEGHPGWRIDQLDANIVSWLNSTDPRTILLHIGTNDINQDYDVANAPARLSKLIDDILRTKPNVQLFVAQIITEQGEPHATMVNTYNAAIPGIVAAKGSHVHLVNMHAALTEADLADGVHPLQEGYDKMAPVWYNALASVPASLQPLPAGGTTVVSLRAHADNQYVTAENAGAAALIANRAAIGLWETFDEIDLGGGQVALRAHANNKYVTAPNNGTGSLVASSTGIGPAETFDLIHDPDGAVSLRAHADNQYVTAENAGAAALIANRAAIGPWEEFDQIND